MTADAQASRDLAEMRDRIAQAAEGLELLAGAAPAGGAPGALPSPLDVARLLRAQRRRRGALFGADLFADPAWDLLLDLYLSADASLPVPPDGAWPGIACSPATAARWLRVLEAEGLVERADAAGEAAGGLVRLAPAARRLMTAYLVDFADRWPG